MKRLILDIDDTLCWTGTDGYSESQPVAVVKRQIDAYRAMGFEIVLSSSRNMRTFEGNVGKINANTLPILMDWLAQHEIHYDEIYMGKPWCGTEGFYVDDKAVRPIEFATMKINEINELLKRSAAELKTFNDGESQ